MARFVLVHGGFSGAWIWLPLMDRLKADGPVVEAFDLPGMGNDNTSASEVSLDNYAGRVCEVLAASSEPGIVLIRKRREHMNRSWWYTVWWQHARFSWSFTIATVVDALLWMLTTVIALAFALKGKIQQHRQWMTRSYAVAIVFLEVRMISGIGGWHSFAITETVLWVCLALSLLLADIAIHWQDLWSARSVVAKAIPTVRSQGVASANRT